MKIKTFLFKSHKNSIKSHKSNNNNDIISYCFILKTITKYFLNYIKNYFASHNSKRTIKIRIV